MMAEGKRARDLQKPHILQPRGTFCAVQVCPWLSPFRLL